MSAECLSVQASGVCSLSPICMSAHLDVRPRPWLADLLELAPRRVEEMFHLDRAAVAGCQERRVYDDVPDGPAGDLEVACESVEVDARPHRSLAGKVPGPDAAAALSIREREVDN